MGCATSSEKSPVGTAVQGTQVAKKTENQAIADTSDLSPVTSYLAASFSRDDLQIRNSITYLKTVGDENLSASLRADLMQYQLILGAMDEAVATAYKVYNNKDGRLTDRVDASMVLAAHAIGQADYARALSFLDLQPQRELSKIGTIFMKSWSHVGNNDYQRAHAVLSPLHDSPDVQVLARIHSSYMYARRGNYQQAYDVIAKIERAPEGILRHKLQLLGWLNRWDEAEKILTQFKRQGLSLPPDLVSSIAHKTPIAFKSLAPMARVGQSFLELSQSLSGFHAYLGLVYAQKARLAGMESLDDAWFDSYMARLLGEMGAIDDAIFQLQHINNSQHNATKDQAPPQDTAGNISIKILLVELYRKIENYDGALTVLDSLRDIYSCEPSIWELYGDIYNRQKRYGDAQDAYTEALDCIENSETQQGAWVLYFKRGDAFASEKKWDKTEPDLQIAHRLSPDNALILNYLGYMWIEQNKNTDQALEMIKKSLTLDPDNGATVDSLGWAYYQLGRYEEAIVQLERATDMEKNEPVVTDHLGDAYWRVGRKREAIYQWQRVLDLHENNPRVRDEIKAIRKKLIDGLPPIPPKNAEENPS